MPGRGVGAVVECESLDGSGVPERDAIVERHVEQLGRVLVEAVERINALEEEEAACERPYVGRAHEVLRGADDLRRSVGCRPPDAHAPVVEVCQLDLHLPRGPCEQDVGRAQISVVHVVCVQVADSLCDGERHTELDMERVRFPRGPVVLERDAHALHVDDAVLDTGDTD